MMSNKKIFFIVCGIIILCLITAKVPAFGQKESKALEPQIPEFVQRQQRVRAERKERLAYEAYEKRNAEITPWVEDDTSPKHCNAALLYYQAFILQPDYDWPMSQKLKDVVLGKQKADKQVKTYMGHCLPAIEMVEIASRLPQCSWGIRYLQTPGYDKNFLVLSDHRLKTILIADAMILAAEGHYRVAFERCMTLRRFYRHLIEDPKFIHSTISEFEILRTIQHVLGIMPPDEEILTWFRGQFTIEKGPQLSFAKTLQADFKSYLNYVRENSTYLNYDMRQFIEKDKNEQAKQDAMNLTDEQFILRAGRALQSFLDSIFRILDSEINFEQKQVEMRKISSDLTGADEADPLIKYILLTIINIEGTINEEYPSLVGCQAHINGVKAAVEVYLVLAKTGQLPKTLPDGLPKDPFTGKDFIYEITDEGFALRCQGEEFLRRKSRDLEFKVKK